MWANITECLWDYDHLEQHAEGEGEGDDHQQPGDAEEEPAQEAEARVAALLHGAR